MGQLFERLAAEKISVSACDLRELTRDRRVRLGVDVADAAGAIQVPTTRRVVQVASLAAAIRGRESSPQPRARLALMGAGDGVLMRVES